MPSLEIALSLGASSQTLSPETVCQSLADAEIDDSITLLAPQWGSAVEGGVDHGGLGFA